MGQGKDVEYWINGTVIGPVTTLGIIGNLICSLLLFSKKLCFTKTFLNLLRWLAFIDSVFLFFCFFTFSLPQLSEYYRYWIYPYMMPTLLPMTSIFLNASMYCVVSLAIERYLTVCQPQYMNQGSFRGYILPIFVFSAFFNLPKFFELRTDYVKDKNAAAVRPWVMPTKFRRSPEYSYYTIGTGFLFLGLIPLVVVSVLNLLVVKKFRSLSPTDQTYRFRSDKVSGCLLSGIVIVMIMCHLPRNILNVYEIYLASISAELKFPYPWLVDISHLSLVISSSINVFIFACQDSVFRRMLLNGILCCFKKSVDTDGASTDEREGQRMNTAELGLLLNGEKL